MVFSPPADRIQCVGRSNFVYATGKRYTKLRARKRYGTKREDAWTVAYPSVIRDVLLEI
jgi:hypothetical protein